MTRIIDENFFKQNILYLCPKFKFIEKKGKLTFIENLRSGEFLPNHPSPFLFREAEKFLRFFSIGNLSDFQITPFLFAKIRGRGGFGRNSPDLLTVLDFYGHLITLS